MSSSNEDIAKYNANFINNATVEQQVELLRVALSVEEFDTLTPWANFECKNEAAKKLVFIAQDTAKNVEQTTWYYDIKKWVDKEFINNAHKWDNLKGFERYSAAQKFINEEFHKYQLSFEFLFCDCAYIKRTSPYKLLGKMVAKTNDKAEIHNITLAQYCMMSVCIQLVYARSKNTLYNLSSMLLFLTNT